MKLMLGEAKVSGRYQLITHRKPNLEDIVHDTGEFSNLLTNTGLRNLADKHYYSNISTAYIPHAFDAILGRFTVGGGTNAPSFTDTALQSPLVTANAAVTVVSNVASYALGYYELVVKYEFGEGVAAGNISEIGLTQGSDLTSRSLIKDSEGDPTTITVAANEYLTCIYTLRIAIPQTDAVFNTSILVDSVSTPMDITVRPLKANDNTPLAWGLVNALTGGGHLYAFTGGLAAATASSPSGSNLGITSSKSKITYVADSYESWIKFTASVSQLNGTFSSMLINPSYGCYQIGFSEPITKTNEQALELTFGIKWARG